MIDYKEAIETIKNMIEKYSFTQEEKDALWTAIGMLDAGALAKNRQKMKIENRKAKNKKN